MYMVARQTKFQVSERVGTPDDSSITTSKQVVLNQAHKIIPGNPDISQSHHTNSITPSIPTQAVSKNLLHGDWSPPQAASAQVPVTSPLSLIPNFSLNSYLDMINFTKGNINDSLRDPTTWGQHLLASGILEYNNTSLYNHPTHQTNVRRLPLPLISTPLDPAVVPAEDLNVYWNHPRKTTISIPFMKSPLT